MGFIYTTKTQNQPYPHANLSLLSYLQSAVEDLKRRLLQNGYPQEVITFQYQWYPEQEQEPAKWTDSNSPPKRYYYFITLSRSP